MLALLGGLALAASFAVSAYLFWYGFTSAWCFFAALLALSLCYVFSCLPGPGTGPKESWADEVTAGGPV